MGEHLLFSEHLTGAKFDSPIRQTFLGQAHIAGTGPQDKTCRECVFWRTLRHKKVDGVYVEYEKPAAYFAKTHKTSPCELKKQKCTRPILNKAKRQIPHHALSCRLFEQRENPPPVKKEAGA